MLCWCECLGCLVGFCVVRFVVVFVVVVSTNAPDCLEILEPEMGCTTESLIRFQTLPTVRRSVVFAGNVTLIPMIGRTVRSKLRKLNG